MEQILLAAQQFVPFRKRLFEMPRPFGDLLFKHSIRQDQGGVGLLKLFRSDLQLLQGDLKFLVDDAELTLQAGDQTGRRFSGRNLGFEQPGMGLGQ